jgi:hypothetical protein
MVELIHAKGGNKINKMKQLQLMPSKFRHLIQSLTCGGRPVKTSVVYTSFTNSRFTLKCSGAWQDVLRSRISASQAEKSLDLFPRAEDVMKLLDGPAASKWPSVLIKLQDEAKMDPDEDKCHSAVNRTCPGMSPRLICSMTISGIRVTFMEWLDSCMSLYDVSKKRPDLMTRQVYEDLREMVRRMWLDAGVLHCDLHMNNVLCCGHGLSDSPASETLETPAKLKCYIIDYGMALLMDEAMRKKLAATVMAKEVPMSRAYDLVCKETVLNVILSRGYSISSNHSDLNDDGSFLRAVWRECHPRDDKAPAKRPLESPFSKGRSLESQPASPAQLNAETGRTT